MNIDSRRSRVQTPLGSNSRGVMDNASDFYKPNTIMIIAPTID